VGEAFLTGLPGWLVRIEYMMRQSIALLSLFALTANAAETVYPLRGYTSASSAKEVQWEEKFRQIPDTANLREYMRRLSARPHHVGSPYDKDNAEWILAQLKSYGLDAQIETFDTLFPTPQERSLQLLGSRPFTAKRPRWLLIRPRARRASSCQPITPTPETVMSQRRWSM
jgi:hypothetical protein